jgi:hypothetical protein
MTQKMPDVKQIMRERRRSSPVLSLSPFKKTKVIDVDSEDFEEINTEDNKLDFLDREDDIIIPELKQTIVTFQKKPTKKIEMDTSIIYDYAEPASTIIDPVIVMTGVDVELYHDKVVALGGEIQLSTNMSPVTHLVAERFVRTSKFLSAMCFPVQFIVHKKWLEVSIKNGYFVDEKAYPIVDLQAEETYNFKLAESLNKSARKRVFEGFLFFLTPSIKPEVLQLAAVIKCGGGRVLPEAPKSYDQNLIVITCEEDEEFLRGFRIHVNSKNIYQVEFIVMGAIKQHLDFTRDRFDLIMDD